MPGVYLDPQIIQQSSELGKLINSPTIVKPDYDNKDITKVTLQELHTARSYQRKLAVEEHSRTNVCPVCLEKIQDVHVNNNAILYCFTEQVKKRQRVEPDER